LLDPVQTGSAHADPVQTGDTPVYPCQQLFRGSNKKTIIGPVSSTIYYEWLNGAIECNTMNPGLLYKISQVDLLSYNLVRVRLRKFYRILCRYRHRFKSALSLRFIKHPIAYNGIEAFSFGPEAFDNEQALNLVFHFNVMRQYAFVNAVIWMRRPIQLYSAVLLGGYVILPDLHSATQMPANTYLGDSVYYCNLNLPYQHNPLIIKHDGDYDMAADYNANPTYPYLFIREYTITDRITQGPDNINSTGTSLISHNSIPQSDILGFTLIYKWQEGRPDLPSIDYMLLCGRKSKPVIRKALMTNSIVQLRSNSAIYNLPHVNHRSPLFLPVDNPVLNT
jgi:hypothetical protein